ncbi:MAG: copper homeostasis protein CutC [Armatimonadota bacterium]
MGRGRRSPIRFATASTPGSPRSSGSLRLNKVERVVVEIIACSADDCEIIEASGADRIELCAAIALGGLTPSLGLLTEARRRTRLPLMVMLRPRDAGMAYSEGDTATMLADLPFLLDQGADGIVTGISLPGGELDRARLEPIARRVKDAGRELVLHRAFDLTPDPFAALEAAIDLGFDRVLTSGQRPTAAEGATLIAELVRAARGRITILPGGGIEPDNVADLIAQTAVTEVHLALFAPVKDHSTRADSIHFGNAPPGDSQSFSRADEGAIHGLVTRVRLTG